MTPYLLCLKDGKAHTMGELTEFCAQYLKLTDEDRKERTKKGSFTKLYDRTQWTGTYLRKAKAIESPQRGKYQIVPRGIELLEKFPAGVFVKSLQQFPEFLEFSKGSKSDPNPEVMLESVDNKTPLEMIDDAFSELTKELAEELLQTIKAQTPQFFENLVVKLLVAMGYGGSLEDAASVTQLSHDEGIDGVIKEDRLGFDRIYVQAKRYGESPIGRKEIHSFVGALTGKGASKGVFITTSSFTKEALSYKPMNGIKIVLIDGVQLANYMIDLNLGVSVRQTYEIKKLDTDFFNE